MFDRNNHSSSNRRPKNTLKLITNQVVMNNLCQVPNFLIKNKLDEIYLKCLTSCHRCLTSCHRCSFFRLIQDGIHQLLQFSIFIIVRITKNITQIILAFIHVLVFKNSKEQQQFYNNFFFLQKNIFGRSAFYFGSIYF